MASDISTYIRATKKLLKLRKDRKGDSYTDFLYGEYNKIMREVEFPLTEDQLVEAAVTCGWEEFIAVISRNDNFGGTFRNQLADEHREIFRAKVGHHRAVIDASTWRTPTFIPWKDENKFETEYRRKTGLGWDKPLHEVSIAMMAEEVYGKEWKEAYSAIMDASGGLFDADNYVYRRYIELRGESYEWHEYRQAIGEYIRDRKEKMTEANRRGVIERLLTLRSAVRAAGVSLITGKKAKNHA